MEEKKKLLCSLISLVIILSMAVVLLSTVVEASPATEIWDWYGLDAIRNNLDGSYILMNDLDSTTAGYAELASPTANAGKGWEPIGTQDDPFTGTFDGERHKISDLYIYRPAEFVGLFGYVGYGGVLEDIGMLDIVVTGYRCVGSLVGENYKGTVSNCYATGSIFGHELVGGLVGYSWGTMSNCYATGNVTGDYEIGGLAGCNWGTISNCCATSSVTGDYLVGGLLAGNGDTVSNCYATGNIMGDNTAGGLIGSNYEGTVSSCYATGSVTGSYFLGGLVGENDEGVVSKSYAMGDVSGVQYVGGLVGESSSVGTINNCYATGSVTGSESIGGLLGSNSWSTVTNCYAIGNVTGDSDVGGLVGLNDYGIVSNSFWDVETSGQATSTGGTGKTTSQMKSFTTFSAAGWNIIAVANPSTRNPSYIWNIVDDVTYPFLSWEQRTWYVDDDLADYPGADFTKIQDAVNAANPGDTIIVYPGTYTENVDVNKEHLTIQSQNGAEATIAQAANSGDHVFELTADYVEISGFTVKDALYPASAIYLASTQYCKIININVSACFNGIYSSFSNNNVFENNAISECNDGIFLDHSDNNTIRNNNLARNGDCAIRMESSSSNNVIKNDASQGDYWYHDDGSLCLSGVGLYMSSNSNSNEVVDNILVRNIRGISVWGSNNTILNNQVSGVTGAPNNRGIELNSSNNIIKGNTLETHGLFVWSSNNNIYFNDFLNSFVYSHGSSTSSWNSPGEITYTYNGKIYTNYLGNHWSDYLGSDLDGDGIGDTPYPIDSDADNYPLMEAWESYFFVVVSIDAPDEVGIGDTFPVDIFVDPDTDIAGVQFNLSFNPSFVTANNVTEGNLLSQGGASTYFMSGTINNTSGTITNVAGIIVTPGASVSQNGTFATVSFTAGTAAGTSGLDLSKVIVADLQGQPVAIIVTGGNVTIGKTGDVNNDDHINILDMVLIGQHWGQTGSPGWIAADVKPDGIINVLDMIVIGQNWTG